MLRDDVHTIGMSTAAVTESEATVSWVASDGTPHTGQAMVRAGGRAGDTTTIWLDAAGRAGDSAAEPRPDRHGRGRPIGVATRR
ncbi:hypothetical protein ACU686_13820 [Yinghuangia aomiensis]